MDNRNARSSTVALVVALGSLWGFIEATLGYGLHLLRRVTPLPGLTGYLLFPIGFFIMLAAARQSGKSTAAIGVAAVAALVKASSGFLPSVAWIFVVNPALAILAEGAIVGAGVAMFSFRRSPVAIPQALAVSVVWRALFLGLVFVLPVQKGILMKGTQALLTFVLFDSAVNALLVGTALWAGLDVSGYRSGLARFAAPLAAAATFVVAVGAEIVVNLV